MTISHQTLQDRKKNLRQTMRILRESKSKEELKLSSQKAQEHLLTQPFWKKAQCIALYLALPRETATDLLYRTAFEQKKAVYVPRVLRGRAGVMEFVELSPNTEFIRGSFGIPEPHPEYSALCKEEFFPDLFILPGLAFDRTGLRLGYGGGYFDRFLAGKKAIRVGLCFHFQILPALPGEPWDQRMDFLCSEEGLFKREKEGKLSEESSVSQKS